MSKELLPCWHCGGMNISTISQLIWCEKEDCTNQFSHTRHDWNNHARHAHDLRQENARIQREQDEALIYLSRLATSLVKQHYPENKEWMPLNTVLGVIGQIDNATTRWKDDVSRLEAENARLREALQYYAESRHYTGYIGIHSTRAEVVETGERARKALEGK